MITAGMVKELRERTGAGMMDCKRRWVRLMVIWKRLLIICGKKAWLPPQKS